MINPQAPSVTASIPSLIPNPSAAFFVPPLFLKIPGELVRWLLEDLSLQNIRKIVSNPIFNEQLKGYRPQSLPRDKAISMLKDEFFKNVGFRSYVGSLWHDQKKEVLKLLDCIPVNELVRHRQKLLKQFGFPLLYWYGLFSESVVLQKLAIALAKGFFHSSVSPWGQGKREGIAAGSETLFSKEVPQPVEETLSELKQLKNELAAMAADKEKLELQLESSRHTIKKSEIEITNLKTELCRLKNSLESELKKGKERLEKARETEEKIRALSSADQTIRSLEKRNRSLSHELQLLRAEKDRVEQNLQNSVHEKELSELLENEMNKTLSALFRAFASPPRQSVTVPTGTSVRKGQSVLVIGGLPQLSSEYYRTISSVGLILSYHAGFQRDMELERMLAKSSGTILFLSQWEEVKEHMDLVGYLRKNNVSFFILPSLPPENFLNFALAFSMKNDARQR